MLDFIGREGLEGTDDQLTYAHSDVESDFDRSQGLTGILALGVARYAVLFGQSGPFTVNTPTERDRVRDLPPGLQGEVNDPWDYWVFGIGGNVEYEEEDLKDENKYGANFSANRTTEMWKITVNGRGSYSKTEGVVRDTVKYENVLRSGSADGRVFYSLAERLSVGVETGVSTSSRNNQKLGGQVGAGIEYSFFPYRDWTRRRMTFQAQVNARYFEYDTLTTFQKTSETVAEGALKWALGFRQPWGTASLNAAATAFLHDPTDLYNLTFGGRVSIRIARGLDWNISGEIKKIQDQIYLPAAALSAEDIYLGRIQLPTDSKFAIRTGFSFNFGSIYNNIVNNRFGYTGGGGGGGRGFF